MTSGLVSRLTGIPLQTLISWDRTGALTAIRSGPRKARRYDQDGVIAALFARHLSAMGFRGNRLAELLRLMQSADRKTLRSWVIYSYRSLPGLISHDAQPARDAARHVDVLRERKQLIDDPTDLWAVREGLREIASNLIEKRESIFPLAQLMEDD